VWPKRLAHKPSIVHVPASPDSVLPSTRAYSAQLSDSARAALDRPAARLCDAMDANERQVDAAAGDGPSFDDLLFDDTLDDLERIGRYATSAIALQRLVHVRLVGETARAVGCVLRARAPARPRDTCALCAQRPSSRRL
jgi:hypothetical protein